MVRELHVGEAFAGYRIRSVLGRGGMGAVYAAEHPRLPRLVAIKTLTADAADPDARRRFEREAEMVARLDHPNIVSVLDRGIDEGIAWISMQLVDGADTGRLLRRHGPFPPERALHVIEAVAGGLDEAHRHGIVHRDVKPGNVMVRTDADGRERVLLTDFGIGAMAGGGEVTARGEAFATLEYASPEQLRGEPLDGRADQYSLACTAYALLAGHPPFQGVPQHVLQQQFDSSPAPISQVQQRVPAAVDAVIARAMSKDRQHRFPSCESFAAALRDAIAPAARRRRAPLVAIAAGVAVTAAAATALAMSQHSRGGASAGPRIAASSSVTAAEVALWSTAAPALQEWPQLLPSSATTKGYRNMVCTPTDTPGASTTVRFTYKLQCGAREDGFNKPTVDVDLLAYSDEATADRALQSLDPPAGVPMLKHPGMTVYHFQDPAKGTWILATFTAADRKRYHFQVGQEDMTYSQLYDWIGDAPFS